MRVVEFSGVSKAFGSTHALRDVAFRIDEGQRVGLLGPNGSGKTTALRLALGLYRADTGSVRVFGQEPSHRIGERIGYLPEERGLYREMRVDQVLRYYAKLKGAQPSEAAIDSWLSRLDIAQYKTQKVRALSKGTSQKVQFVATVLHDPDLIVLDEPFSGLDPLSRQTLTAAIEHLSQAGKSLVFSTHDMAAAENLCDHFLMLHRGQKVLDENRSGLRERTAERVVRLTTEQPLKETSLPHVRRLRTDGVSAELNLENETDPQLVLQWLAARYRVLRFEVTHPSLEDVFLQLAQD